MANWPDLVDAWKRSRDRQRELLEQRKSLSHVFLPQMKGLVEDLENQSYPENVFWKSPFGQTRFGANGPQVRLKWRGREIHLLPRHACRSDKAIGEPAHVTIHVACEICS